MARTTASPKGGTISFRIEPALKAALTRIADQEARPVGDVLRDLVRARVERKRRRTFEAEARRQSMEAAAVASDPHSDEAAVLREMDAELAAMARSGGWR